MQEQPTSRPVTVAGVQMDVRIGDVEANLAAIEQGFRDAAAQGARLVVFPECAVTGYCFDSLEEAWPWAQTLPGPLTERLGSLCRALDVWCVVGTLEAEGTTLFNTAVLVGPGGLAGRYRKTHLPGLGVDRFVTPGDSPGEVLTCCDGLRIAMNICYDGSFPEPARCLALAGADLVVLPTNWPPGATTFARYLVNARALENNIYYLAVNRVGQERGFDFIGLSRLADTNGNDLAVLDHTQPGIVLGTIDPGIARNKHLIRVPGKHEIHRFRDRRPDLYGPIVAERSPQEQDARQAQGLPRRQLWAPWRLAYVTSGTDKSPPAAAQPAATGLLDHDPDFPPDPNCFLCRVVASDADRENLVIARGEHVVAVLNRYPYNNGHLLVAPKLHKARLADLTPEEHAESMAMITRLVGVLAESLNAEGFNVGLNLGRIAGAGLPGHLHWHIVPRWSGDTNFMSVVGATRVLPRELADTYDTVVKGFT